MRSEPALFLLLTPYSSLLTLFYPLVQTGGGSISAATGEP